MRANALVAENEKEADDRVHTRFPRASGFDVLEIVLCRLPSLSVNRVIDPRQNRGAT